MPEAPATGRLRLRAAARGGRTVLTDVFRTAPFHPGPLHHRDGRAELILQDVSPGIFPGDRLEIDVQVDDGAALVVSGQGATKLYPSPSGILSETRTSLTVDRGGTLWWLPGVLIPFRDACFLARTTVNVQDGARFALLEVITPGRLAMGERDRYRQLDLRLRIESAGRPVLIERAVLDPVARPPAVTGSRGQFACSGSLIMIGYPAPAAVSARCDDVWLGADGERGVVVVRGLASAAAPLQAALRAVLERAESERERNPDVPGAADP